MPSGIQRNQIKRPIMVSFMTLTLILTNSFAFNEGIPEIKAESEYNPFAIPIVQLYQDAKYAWDQLQLRKDVYGPNKTGLFYGTDVLVNINSTSAYQNSLMRPFYAMYKITNDSNYLILAREMFNNILKYCTSQIDLSNKTYDIIFPYNWKDDQIITERVSPTQVYIPLALEDPYYLPFFENLVSTSHDVFWSPLNLSYTARTNNGTMIDSNCHLTWSSISSKIIQLLWLEELTGNQKYKNWADDAIEMVWSYSSIYNLIPRRVDAITGAILDTSVSHYDMAGWLCALELAFILNNRNMSAGTRTHTYWELINATAHGISNGLWHSSQRWNYKTKYSSGGDLSSIPEMNAIYVDYAMILAYEITGNERFLTQAKLDFQNEFLGSDPVIPNGVLMDNSLVIHSPNTFSHQSQFPSSSNMMVARTANLIFQYTQNFAVLQKAKYHYNHFMSSHRFSKGYTDRLDSSTLQPEPLYLGNPPRVYDYAPIVSLLALPNAFIPSRNVLIDWGYGLSTTMPDGYGQVGAFTGISIDMQENRVHLKSITSDIYGSLFVYFAEGSEIQSVLIDGNVPYSTYTGNNLSCEEGTHSYTITFTTPPTWTTTSKTSLPPPISSTGTSTTSNINHSSSSSTTSTENITTSETTGFSLISMVMILIGYLVSLFLTRRLLEQSWK